MSEPVKAHLYPDPAKAKRLDIKRFYLPFVVRGRCPTCGTRSERDLNTDGGGYLSYPRINAPMRTHLWCDRCKEDWEIVIQLDFRLTVLDADTTAVEHERDTEAEADEEDEG